MKTINTYITEKLVIGNNLESGTGYSDEELRQDYTAIERAYTKNEKKVIADKYHIKDIRIEPIKLAILDILRENRKNKKEFTDKDIRDFNCYNLPDNYDKLKIYLDKEPRNFVEYVYNYYKTRAQSIVRRYAPRLSALQNYQVKKAQKYERYLEETK